MFTVDIKSEVGQVGVETTHNRGFTPEELSVDCTNKIISISQSADPVLRQQAEAFKVAIYNTILYYMKQAITSDRTTVTGLLRKQGHNDFFHWFSRIDKLGNFMKLAQETMKNITPIPNNPNQIVKNNNKKTISGG